MATSIGAERIGSTGKRLTELRKRIDRLRAGEAPTPDDVARARFAAVEQRAAAARAYVRLLHTEASAASHARMLSNLGGSRFPVRERVDWSRLVEQNIRLRDALVAIQTYSSPAGSRSSGQHRRLLWQALVDENYSPDWHSWALAICNVAIRLLPDVRGAALTLHDQHNVAYPLAASDGWACQIEEIHQIVGEGPALEVSPARPSLILNDIREGFSRWPGFSEAAASAGLRSLTSFHLPLAGGITGSLTLYRTVPTSFAEADSPEAELLAEVAASALLADVDALNDDEARVYPDGYQDVSIAAGMLSIRWGISVAEAHLQMRAHAYGSGQSLAETAQAVIDGTFHPDDLQ